MKLPNMEFLHRHSDKVVSPLTVEERQPLLAVGPFSQVSGTVMRSERLSPNRYGDAIWSNDTAICVIDASAPHDLCFGLGEAEIVSDLVRRLSAIFDGTSYFNPDSLKQGIDEVLTEDGGRRAWGGQAEFGLSMGGMYCNTTDQITVFNIGTGAVYVDGKVKIPAGREFHNPNPMPGSKVVKNIPQLTILTLSPEQVKSVTICTDGINTKHYSPTSARPITDFIAPRATEAAIVRLER